MRPGAAPQLWRRKVISMCDSCLYKRLLVLGASLVLGVLVYVLLAVGIFSLAPGLLPVVVPMGVAALGLAALIPSVLLCRCAPALAESWSCWGDLVLAGGVGTILSAALAALLNTRGLPHCPGPDRRVFDAAAGCPGGLFAALCADLVPLRRLHGLGVLLPDSLLSASPYTAARPAA